MSEGVTDDQPEACADLESLVDRAVAAAVSSEWPDHVDSMPDDYTTAFLRMEELLRAAAEARGLGVDSFLAGTRVGGLVADAMQRMLEEEARGGAAEDGDCPKWPDDQAGEVAALAARALVDAHRNPGPWRPVDSENFPWHVLRDANGDPVATVGAGKAALAYLAVVPPEVTLWLWERVRFLEGAHAACDQDRKVAWARVSELEARA